MKKKNRKSAVHDYSKYTTKWNSVEIPMNDERYYGLHRAGNRIKVDIKRMKKIKSSGIPESVLQAASSIPRNTTYFKPAKIHRNDYIINQFRDKLTELKKQWHEIKIAFHNIPSPKDVENNARAENLSTGILDHDEANVYAFLASCKREPVYRKLWISQCAQFIHQMATELDALLLRKCVYLGFSEKEVSRGKMHTYLHGTKLGKVEIDDLPHFPIYNKFFTVWNMLKHNSEDLFEKIQTKYPEMLFTNTYKNGEMSQYYLKIGDEYIESMLVDLLPFYEELCYSFFDENIEQAKWNYDDYFIEQVHDTMEAIDNPLGL